MRRQRWWIGIAAGVALGFGAKYFLLDTSAAPGAPFVIELDALHEAAGQGGELPTRIEVEKVSEFTFPRTVVVAGAGFSLHAMALLSHRVLYPDGHSIVLDTAFPQGDAEALPGGKFERAAYQRMEKALAEAQQILFTHEHPDHVGGVASAADYATVAPKVFITREQLDGPRLERDKFAPGRLEQLKPATYTGVHAIAPGIALQKAPGHSDGTQLIYVELASGARYLFVGDIAWSEQNITLQRGRPGVIGLMGEDRAAVASQVQAIAKLPKDVHVVVAHDLAAYQRDLKAGLFHAGFSVR